MKKLIILLLIVLVVTLLAISLPIPTHAQEPTPTETPTATPTPQYILTNTVSIGEYGIATILAGQCLLFLIIALGVSLAAFMQPKKGHQ